MDTLDTMVAYRHTGVPEAELAELMEAVKVALDATGWNWHCTYWEEGNFRSQGAGRREIMDHAREQLDQINFLICIVDSPIDSPGMVWEMGYCRAKKIPILALVRAGCSNTYGADMADKVAEYGEPWQIATILEDVVHHGGALNYIAQAGVVLYEFES